MDSLVRNFHLRSILILVYTFIHARDILAQPVNTLHVAKIFGNNMVIQQGMKVPIWGTALPGEKIRIEFAGFKSESQAGSDGKWMIHLPVLAAGGPYKMKIKGSKTITFKNVMIGEVWLAAGQSNMRWPLSKTVGADKAIANADLKNIRLLKVKQQVNNTPIANLEDEEWQVCSPRQAANFSAVGFYFARELHHDKNVPVGIIQSAWDATAAECWISGDRLVTHSDFHDRVLEAKDSSLHWRTEQKKTEKILEERDHIFQTYQGGIKQGVHLLNYNDENWMSADYPIAFYTLGVPPRCLVWLRKTITLPSRVVEKNLRINLGNAFEWDMTYFNGKAIGNKRWDGDRVYTIPSNLVKEGKNVITTVILSEWSSGRLGLPSSDPVIETEDKSFTLSLKGSWRYNDKIEPPLPDIHEYQNEPTALFNGMIAPLIPYGIRGSLWYQGEANATRPEQYRSLLPLLFTDWRAHWGQGDFPFLIVQLANYANTDRWAELREAQAQALQYPHTGLATAIDVGKSDDIHPPNKEPVGKRLFLLANHIAYGENSLEYLGPVYKQIQIKGDTAYISFDHIGSGLISRDAEPLKEFIIAGSDNIFYPATAFIRQNRVVLYSEKVKDPVAVRYAWSSDPACNFYNKEGLPAFPFRTDNENN